MLFLWFFTVTLLKILLCKEPILESNGNVPNNQKVHLALVKKVDLTLQN